MKRRDPGYHDPTPLPSLTTSYCGIKWVSCGIPLDEPCWQCPKCKRYHDDGKRRRGKSQMLGKKPCHGCSPCRACVQVRDACKCLACRRARRRRRAA